jgi:tryptophanyl-tRNA synthetase
MKKKVFSGIQPTGNIHIGNYLGAVKNWVDSQDEFDNIFCVVDLHAITVKQDPKELKEKIRETAGLLLACGIDPEKSSLFIQSHISAHAELAWILNCYIPMGWMEKMTQFKEKSGGQKERVSIGLFDYPALMAADILLYETEVVPVGEDQRQHVELARDVAKKINSSYGEVFKLPEAKIQKTGARIMGLQNPEKKMSKSEGGEKNVINLLDSPDEIKSKISSAVTDSENEIKFDKKRPGIYNLLVMYKLLTNQEEKEIEEKFKDKGYKEFKEDLSELIISKLKPIQEKYKELTENESYIDNLLKEGANKLEPLAEKTLNEVKTKIGLG